MSFIDKAFARRLESAEEMPQVHYANLCKSMRPELNAAVEKICGGHMIFAGVGSPVGRAAALGLDGPVSAADLDRLEEFYRSHRAPAQVDVCPVTDLGLQEMLKDRGYVMTELNNVLYRQLNPAESFPAAPPGMEIRPARPEEDCVWADVVGRGFHEGANYAPDFHQMMKPMFHVPGAIPFLAFVDGRVAAGSGGLIIPEHRLLALSGAATLPEFRRRGIQTASLHARMKAAAKAGCDMAVTVTRGGTTSEHNAVRLGFQMAYSKATVVRSWG
jgi:GNAT superfamily N-acetyltransferase